MHADLTRMLTDPTPLATGSTGMTLTAFVARNFARVAEGSYIGSDIGTLDQPQSLLVSNKMNFNGVSTITLKTREAFNVLAINGIPQKDDEMEVSLQIKFPHRSSSEAKVQDHVLRVANLCTSAGSLAKLLRGER